MMANQSMIRIEEREDQLRRILMFFNIDFSDRLNNERNCNENGRNPGGGVGIGNKSSTSIGEPNKFYSNCNYNNEINRHTATKCDDQHSRYRHHYRPMEHKNGRDNIDHPNRQFRPHRIRQIPSHLQERPVDISDFEYNMKNYGMERSCRKPHYSTDSKEYIREPELSPRPSYRSIVDIKRAYSKHKPYPRSESHYEYCKHITQPLKRPPPIPESAYVPNEYNSHCETPQRLYRYSNRQYADSEPTSFHPRSARKRQRQASGSMACEYPPLYGHGSYESDIRQDYAPYTPDYRYKKHTNRMADHDNYHGNSRYAKYDYYDQRPIDYDYYDTPRNRLSSVGSRDNYYYEEAQSSISPGPIPNEYGFYTSRDDALKPSRKSKYEYKEKRSKPPKSTFPTEYSSNYQTPSYSKDHPEKVYRKTHTEKNSTSRKSVDFRGFAGLDGDTEIPHRIMKQSTTVSLNKRNNFCTDKREGHTGVRFSGVDIPYKQKERRNSFAARCDSQPLKRHDSGCDYRNNVNRVSVACQRSCRCQASQACLRPNYRCLYEPRRSHRRSLKQRISGFLRKSKVCLKRTKRRAFGSKRYLNNPQSQCCACANGSSPKSRSCLDTIKRSASRLTVRNKWYCKPQNDCPCAVRSRNETSVKCNAFRQHVYPTVYREKSTCGFCNEENYQRYSMLNCERACPTGRSRVPTSRCCIQKCYSNDDCPRPCLSSCSKISRNLCVR
ncbi:uncharacterized protein LOC26528972 isoform X2 [Drosophila willistoni]|uniref:uncharacterized protein LOC26528972 isoform X2 n=1 Tax=Drosophila willistoni TaxID=7260 RepID=UPI000C26C692|nr:uncharacterized protein LOC26528972 isoform X2 [Drosophila willistoni]